MSLVPRLRKRYHTKPNPYSTRGLDKFALVAAELSAKRESLAAQLGEPVSVVRFTTGSQSTWIPIFIHQREGASHSVESHDVSDAFPNSDVAASGAPLSIRPISLKPLGSEGASRDADSEVPTYSFFTGKDQRWSQFFKSITVLVMTMGAFWVGKIAALGLTLTVALACGVLLRKWHRKRDFSTNEHSVDSANQLQDEIYSLDFAGHGQEHQSESVAMELPIRSQNEITPPPPSLPRIAVASVLAPAGNSTASSDRDNKQRNRFKSRFLHKHICKKEPVTAPSSPLASSEASVLTSTPSSPSFKGRYPSGGNIFGVQGNHSHGLAGKSSEEKKVQRMVPHDQQTRKSQEKRIIKKPISAWTTIGLVVAMAGLLAGYSYSIIGVVCWWYVLPKLREVTGEKPVVRMHAEAEKTNEQGNNKNNMVSNGYGRVDLQSSDYRKKVIMEGLLDRNKK